MGEQNSKGEFDPLNQYNFESKSKDPGISYIENMYHRKIHTINKIEIIKGLKHAAEHGDKDNKISNLQFVRQLFSSTKIVFSTTKEERLEIFKLAVQHDNSINKLLASRSGDF